MNCLYDIEKPSNDPKDSKPDNDIDGIFPFSGDVIKHSVSKNYDSSNTDCDKSNIKDSDVPTAVTENEFVLSKYICGEYVIDLLMFDFRLNPNGRSKLLNKSLKTRSLIKLLKSWQPNHILQNKWLIHQFVKNYNAHIIKNTKNY